MVGFWAKVTRSTPSIGTEISFARFLAAGRTPAGQMALFLSPASAGLFLGQAMKQPVSAIPIVTHDMGAIIGLFTLVAINLACIGSFVLGWW
jgi:hypothetical protein